jgi:DNA polymerase-3 subunit alpha
MDNIAKLQSLSYNINLDKLEQLKNNKYFQSELDIIFSSKQVTSYYIYIIKSVELDKTNSQNSYIMWVFDKVDEINLNQPANIVPSRVSLPDVDMDFEIRQRGSIIEYIRNKYGSEYVGQMLTFTRLQGRGALKDVLRAHGVVTPKEMDIITSCIPGESEISDQLQEMKDADKNDGGDGEASIIQWAIEHHAKDLKPWVYLDNDGNLQGPLSKYFEQAIRIEGTKKSQSKHPAGVIISKEPLASICPMVYDKTTEEMICGMEMSDMEAMGLVKMDCLGVSVLDKVHNVIRLLAGSAME